LGTGSDGFSDCNETGRIPAKGNRYENKEKMLCERGSSSIIYRMEVGKQTGCYTDQAGGGDESVWQTGGWVIRRRRLIDR
jgi:hypothetical protein